MTGSVKGTGGRPSVGVGSVSTAPSGAAAGVGVTDCFTSRRPHEASSVDAASAPAARWRNARRDAEPSWDESRAIRAV
jgi:hypothetical protein